MASFVGNEYVSPVGPNGIRVWRPTASAFDELAQASASAGGGGSSGGTGGTGGTTGGTSGMVVAQALFYTATCQSSDAIGSFVRADTGSNAVTSVTCFQPYPAIGCIISKSNATTCVVQTYGLNGAFAGLKANSRYFVGPQGQPVLAINLPGNAPYVQPIGFAVQSQQLFIQPSGTLYRRDTSSPSTPESGSGDTVDGYYGGLLRGEGPPDADLGRQNDTYIETSGPQSVALWGPKPEAGDWGQTRVSLVGTAGNRIYTGFGDPDPSIAPNANDLYFDRTLENPRIFVAA